MGTEVFIPAEVTDAYALENAVVEKLAGGDLATITYRAKANGAKYILQRLAPDFSDPGLEIDFEAVTDHLTREGWEAPNLVKTQDNARSAQDEEGHIWRVMTNIEADPFTPAHPDGTKVGQLLGRLHVSLAKLDYQPEFNGLAHFHDTSYHLEVLDYKASIFADPEAQNLAARVLRAYDRLGVLDETDQIQLIHGDPRTANMLYRNEQPFTVIDFDTIMQASIWVDVGDLLRSLAEDAEKDNRSFTLDELSEVVEAYRTIAYPKADAAKFQATAIKAMKLISLELAARFLNDIDGDYFGTAPGFETHTESNLYRVRQQWDIHQLFGNEQEAA